MPVPSPESLSSVRWRLLMPELLHPGVYVQEVPAAVMPIEGVSTSTAAFIGIADKGPIPGTKMPNLRPAQPLLVTSFTEYTRNFGGFRSDSFLTYAARGFFDNGGRRLYIVRVAPATIATAHDGPFSASSAGAWGNNIWIRIDNSSDGDTTHHFKLSVFYGATQADAEANLVEAYDNVTFHAPGDPTPINYARSIVNSRSEYIVITADIPSLPPNLAITQLAGGDDQAPAAVDFVAAPSPGSGV